MLRGLSGYGKINTDKIIFSRYQIIMITVKKLKLINN